MKIIFVALVLFFSVTVNAQETTKEMKDPSSVVKRDFPDTHEVKVTFPRETPILKDRKEIPEGSAKAPDQGYQVACQNGDLKRCSGVDLSTSAFEARVKISKGSLAPVKAPKPRTFGKASKSKPKK